MCVCEREREREREREKYLITGYGFPLVFLLVTMGNKEETTEIKKTFSIHRMPC